MPIDWTKIEGISLARAARRAGFDIAVFDDYAADVQQEIRKRTIKEAVDDISQTYETVSGQSLESCKRSVYVICLAWPLSVKYGLNRCDVLYVGEGAVSQRIKSHFEESLFDVMQSLNGADFTFHISEPRQQRAKDYYQHLEWALLDEFQQKYGGGNNLPLLNRQKGSDRGNYQLQEGWNKPLKNTGKKPRWLVEATSHNEFKKLE